MSEHPHNAHLAPVFERMLPTLEAAGIGYWVYGGVGVAGALGGFIRDNNDVDAYVLEEDFDKAHATLADLSERAGWTVKEPAPLRERRKFEVWMPRPRDGESIEGLSIVPVFASDGEVLFVSGKMERHNVVLSNDALTCHWRDVAGYLCLPRTRYALRGLRLQAFSDNLSRVASVLVSLLHSLRLLVRSRASLHLEVIALRHQIAVLNRSRRRRLLLTPIDRMLWAWLSEVWCGWRSGMHIVQPETVIGWHRRGFRLFWRWKSRHRTGRPGVPADLRALIRELSTANPLWGAPRIHGELQKLGIPVSQSTVAKYMRRRHRPPSQTWRTFLTSHASQIMAADLFVVPTVTFRLLFVLVILAHDRRRLVHVAVTDHPTAAWTAQQLRNAFPNREAPGYLLHDRDAIFAAVAPTIAAMDIQAVRTAPRSPWQNAIVERVIGSIRRECLDHVIIVSAAGLRRVLTGYVAYYMQSRTHLALEKDAPVSRTVLPPSVGRIMATPQVGGLHHRYDRAAA